MSMDNGDPIREGRGAVNGCLIGSIFWILLAVVLIIRNCGG